jgi:predicted secreted protein
MLLITQDQAGQTFTVSVGDHFQIRLTENRLPLGTSGHHWEWRLEEGSQAIVLVKVEHDDHDTTHHLQGHLTATFRVDASGQSMVKATSEKVDQAGNVLEMTAALTFTLDAH